MPLSLKKLQEMLYNYSLLTIRWYTMNGSCAYIEVQCKTTAENFLVYIPSDYNFEMETCENVHELKEISELNDDEQVNIDEDKVGNFYEQLQLNLDQFGGDKMRSHLQEGYKKKINLKSIDDLNSVKAITRQLKRLKFCVEHVKYKVAIFYQNSFSVIRRSDDVEAYIVIDGPYYKKRKMFVTTDIEVLFNRKKSMVKDIKSIENGLQKTLEKNQNSHSRNITSLFDRKVDMQKNVKNIQTKISFYETYINKFELLFEKLNDIEEELLIKENEIRAKIESSESSFHADITLSHERTKHIKKVKDLEKYKKKITERILFCRNELNNLLLEVDSIFFESSVMISESLANFDRLEKLSRSLK